MKNSLSLSAIRALNSLSLSAAIAAALLCALSASHVRAEEPSGANPAVGKQPPAPVVRPDEVPRDENMKLSREVELLRKENQALRRQLVLLKNRMVAAGLPVDGVKVAAPDGKGGVEVGEGSEGLKYSLSTNGIRHNSRCRYYNASPDRKCGKDDGRPCKTCGG